MAKPKLYTFYMGLYGGPTRHVFKMASQAVTWMPSSNVWRTKSKDLDKSITYFYQGRPTTTHRLVEFVLKI